MREARLRGTSHPLARFIRVLGPGIVTGASDDDPSGIATYAVAGASLGYSSLWTALFTLPMMVISQYLSAKIGLVTGRGLASVLRLNYSRYVVLPLIGGLVVANTINAGADMGAIAAAVNLLVPVKPIILIVPIGGALLALQIWGSYRLIANVFKWLALALFAYIGAAFFARPDWAEVLRGTFVPHLSLSAAYVTTLVAILGTTISPYMFFWQAIQEVEEDISAGRTSVDQRRGTTDAELRYASWDINAGMLFSNVVMYFIILATAATLHVSGHTNVSTAADAAKALAPLAGKWAELLLAVGLIGAGALAVPILTSSSAYALSAAFGWRGSLSAYPRRAPQFYSIIAVSTLVGVAINFLGISPVKALFWTAVINGVLAPILLAAVVIITNNRRIMGERVNRLWENAGGWLTVAALSAATVAFFAFWGRP